MSSYELEELVQADACQLRDVMGEVEDARLVPIHSGMVDTEDVTPFSGGYAPTLAVVEQGVYGDGETSLALTEQIHASDQFMKQVEIYLHGMGIPLPSEEEERETFLSEQERRPYLLVDAAGKPEPGQALPAEDVERTLHQLEAKDALSWEATLYVLTEDGSMSAVIAEESKRMDPQPGRRQGTDFHRLWYQPDRLDGEIQQIASNNAADTA